MECQIASTARFATREKSYPALIQRWDEFPELLPLHILASCRYLVARNGMNFSTLMNLPVFDSKGKLNVIIETPKGSRNKFNYDSQLGIFRLKKILPAGASFPFDFGFIPGTLGEDGDPLDVLLLMDEPAFAGCLVPSRLIGVIEAMQFKHGTKHRNDRLIAIADKAEVFCNVSSVANLNPMFLNQIEHFFISYNQVEGKRFKPLRRSGPAAARKIIKTGQRAFADQKEKTTDEK